jgi:hypothetical protein
MAVPRYTPAMKQEKPQPTLDDVLRRMLATPPTPHEKTLVKARKKRAKKKAAKPK